MLLNARLGTIGLIAVVWAMGLVACSTTLTATSDFDSRFDFSEVGSVVILPIDRTTPAEKLISDMQVTRINTALKVELEARGYRVVDQTSEADLQLVWHLVTREKTDIRSYNATSAYNCWRCGPPVSDVSVRQFTEGTFVVDLIDPARSRSVWRSMIQSQLSAKPDPEKAASNRAKAAKAIFAPFPPVPE
ncbi:MAG: hypothetical protein ACI87W_003527 [Halieaceae bacterium]|jgi:hypothetical protein